MLSDFFAKPKNVNFKMRKMSIETRIVVITWKTSMRGFEQNRKRACPVNTMMVKEPNASSNPNAKEIAASTVISS